MITNYTGMEKKIFAFAFLALAALCVVGQALRKTEKIDQSQVPMAIQLAFENDFGTIPKDGYWTANFIVERENRRSVAKPLSYTYHKKSKSEKIEIRYLATGELDFAKGVEAFKAPKS